MNLYTQLVELHLWRNQLFCCEWPRTHAVDVDDEDTLPKTVRKSAYELADV
ncbi:hypothetical protein ABE021_06270 [Sporosarcina gallistercoris]|uniref:hypothetical protein n=1 Tax=Sporosarcina gallistercoris TaxID=2762245 RepID=UPI003D2AA44F